MKFGEPITVTPGQIAMIIALRESLEGGTFERDDIAIFLPAIQATAEQLWCMREVIQASTELDACVDALRAREIECDTLSIDPRDDDRAMALNAMVALGRIVYHGAIHDWIRPLTPSDCTLAKRESAESRVAFWADRVMRRRLALPDGAHEAAERIFCDERADPDELLNTIPARELGSLKPRQFDPDPDRETEHMPSSEKSTLPCK